VIKSTIAGVKPENIDISINNDMLTIRGRREVQEEISDENYLIKECYWGGFSRSVILPVEVDAESVDASLENGILTITLPKAKTAKQFSIKVKEKKL
jgi:HSP20 family protein